jgi:hypothetical protein
LNGGGKEDMVGTADDSLRVMRGDGRGGFEPAPGSPLPIKEGGAWRLAISDLNGDGQPDITTSNLESSSVTVLISR